jgi:chromosome segregation ATPase
MAETVETLNIRVGIVESEVEGEKAVTRYNLEQVRLNTGELTAFRAEARLRLDSLVSDMTLVKAAQVAQGGTLNILVQDVREMRTEMMAMRREMGEVRREIGEVRTDMGEMRTEMGTVRTEMGEMRTEMGTVRTEMGEVNRRLSAIEQSLTTLIAAIAPRHPG